MVKLVILIGPLEDPLDFDSRWPEFLHLAESLPGLQRETSSRVDQFLYGKTAFNMIHELYFASRQELQAALTSPAGEAAGRMLQQISRGQVTLLIADHREDEMPNILKYRQGSSAEGEEAPAA